MAKLRNTGPAFDPELIDTRIESWLEPHERARLADLAEDYRTAVRNRDRERERELSNALRRTTHVLAYYRIVGGCSVVAAEQDWARRRRMDAQRAAGWTVEYDGTVTHGPAEAMASR